MGSLPVLHMNKGEGENSYAKNSNVQSAIISRVKPVIEKAMVDYFASASPTMCFSVADLGCSSGPNTWKVVSHIIDAIMHANACYLKAREDHATGQLQELVVYLNDLPWNDFNQVFASLPSFYNKLQRENEEGFCHCFVRAVPGSFHGRLFQSNSLHFVHSSTSLQWLSKVPPMLEATARPRLNKGKIYISRDSSELVVNAYASQFREDFLSFLTSRSIEVVPGGCMVLTLIGRRSTDPTVEEDSFFHWEILGRSIMALVSEGLVEEDKVDSFNIPYYVASAGEVRKLIEKEGSFEIRQFEIFELDWDRGGDEATHHKEGSHVNGDTSIVQSKAQNCAAILRACSEGILQNHFGREILDHLFFTYTQMLDGCFSQSDPKLTNLTVSLVRKLC